MVHGRVLTEVMYDVLKIVTGGAVETTGGNVTVANSVTGGRVLTTGGKVTVEADG